MPVHELKAELAKAIAALLHPSLCYFFCMPCQPSPYHVTAAHDFCKVTGPGVTPPAPERSDCWKDAWPKHVQGQTLLCIVTSWKLSHSHCTL